MVAGSSVTGQGDTVPGFPTLWVEQERVDLKTEINGIAIAFSDSGAMHAGYLRWSLMQGSARPGTDNRQPECRPMP